MSKNQLLFSLAVLLLLAVIPVAGYLLGMVFWIDVATRLVILSIAAVSLNLLLGYAGLASFGHAAFIGIGAYAVGVPVYHETYGGLQWLASYSAGFHIALAVGLSALFALITGAISLRTKGIHFIMITMAFSQMMYYALVSLEEYGADDGLSVDLRSEVPGLSLDDPLVLYALCYISLILALLVVWRLAGSRFGQILVAAKWNEQRIRALGVNAYRYQLVAYVISGAMCGYAGALMANYTTFISPSMLEWSRSGELMFMVILGGTAYLFGPVLGAVAFIMLEFYLSRLTLYWHLPFGLLLILAVLLLNGGLAGLSEFKGGRRQPAEKRDQKSEEKSCDVSAQ